MIALGLLLLAVAIGVSVAALVGSSGTLAVEVFDLELDTTISGVFFVGVVTGVIALTGVVAVAGGIRRKRAHSREFEYLRHKVAEQERAAESLDDGIDADGMRDWLGQGQQRSRHVVEPAQGGFTPETPSTRAAPTYRTPPRG